MTVGDTVDVDTGAARPARSPRSARRPPATRRSGSRSPRARSRSPPARPTCRSRARTASRSARRSASAPAPSLRGGHGHRGRPAGHCRPACRRTRAAGATNLKVSSMTNISRRRQDPAGHRQPRPRDRVGHGHRGRHARRDRHRPHAGRAAAVRPREQPPVQRLGDRHQLHAGDGVRPLEQRAGAGAGHRHHARRPAERAATRSTPSCATPRSRPRATRARRRPTSGSAAPRSPPAPAPWCCATRPATSPTASTTACSSTRGWPRATRPRRPGSGCKAAVPASAGTARAQRGPLPGRRRHRQQLHRLPHVARRRSPIPRRARPTSGHGRGPGERRRRRHGAGDPVAHAGHAGRVRRVHAGRREDLRRLDDRERDLHRRRRRAQRGRPEPDGDRAPGQRRVLAAAGADGQGVQRRRHRQRRSRPSAARRTRRRCSPTPHRCPTTR